MTKIIKKYQSGIAVLITAFYLMGGLQLPLLECVHFATHIDDLVFGNFERHNFHDHGSSHEHSLLSVLDQSTENIPNQGIPSNEQTGPDSKKSLQIFSAIPALDMTPPQKPALRFSVLALCENEVFTVLGPPPKV